MPAPSHGEELVDLIRKSGVVDDSKLANYLDKQREANTLPTEPRALAGQLVQDGILTYFQAEQLLQGKWKRFTIGKYKVLEKLGVGGMGQVFLCEHKLMRRRVAVKVLPVAKGQDDAARGRFYREARAVAALDHPNIVRAYDIDQDENLHFLVMEFVDGVNLQDLSKRYSDLAKKTNEPYSLDVLRTCHYVYAAAAGLQYASQQGIVHRDIKPSNILVDRSGCVKILDMGLARFFENDDEESLTRKYDENVLGTADYLAPEQAVDSHEVDIRADVYALGASFYFLLCGQAPFAEGSVAQKLLWHQTREPKSLKSLRSDLPDELVTIVQRMMKKDPSERFQTPAEVMVALQPWVQVPIAPPSEDELPRFSLAAVGAPSMASRSGVSVPALSNPSTTEVRSPYSNPQRSSTTMPAHSLQTTTVESAPATSEAPMDWAALGETTVPIASETLRTVVAPSPETTHEHAPMGAHRHCRRARRGRCWRWYLLRQHVAETDAARHAWTDRHAGPTTQGVCHEGSRAGGRRGVQIDHASDHGPQHQRLARHNHRAARRSLRRATVLRRAQRKIERPDDRKRICNQASRVVARFDLRTYTLDL
jgi:eukaryotic-like serine/threonine-protein kinase